MKEDNKVTVVLMVICENCYFLTLRGLSDVSLLCEVLALILRSKEWVSNRLHLLLLLLLLRITSRVGWIHVWGTSCLCC